MTLSRWLRDYLYIPLGGNRGGPRRTYRNLMVTMLLGGLWHGAAWTFLVWGGDPRRALAAERGCAARIGSRGCRRWGLARDLQRGLPRLGVLPRARPRHGFDVLGRLGACGPSPLVTLPVVFAHGRGRGRAGACRRAGGTTPRRGWWPGPPWPRAWRSACSSWPPTPPWASRAWPRSSTTASDHVAPRGQGPVDARGPGARGASWWRSPWPRCSTQRRSCARARA